MSKQILIAVIISVTLSVILTLNLSGSPETTQQSQQTVYDRVMKTKTLRCGYYNWAPHIIVDQSGKPIDGVFYQVMEEFERLTGIKVEWSREILFASIITDLQDEKVDAICAGQWSSTHRSQFISFSPSVFYDAIYAYVRADDMRFDYNLDLANSPETIIAVMDGEMSKEIQEAYFPKAKQYSLPQLSGTAADMMVAVQHNKADIAFADAVNGKIFMDNNPGDVRIVKTKRPIRVIPTTIATKNSETKLQNLFKEFIDQIHRDGTVEEILTKYDQDFPGALIRRKQDYIYE